MGTDDSWNVVLVAEQKVAEGQKQGRFLSMSDADLPPLWERVGSVGVISISGSLVDGSAGWMRLFGVNGYADIIEAAYAAAADPDVKSLMWNVSSGGGHVHGLSDFAAQVNAISKLKPSLTYTRNTMASAAYWSGSAVAGPIIMAPTAEVGSLGVLQVTRNISKALEMEGISMTIHRAGEMKARVNPIEELTPEAKAHLDEQLADLHTMFKSAVKRQRPQMSAEQLAEATDGRIFLGQRAIKVGLADSIGSFELALKLLDKTSRKKDTPQNSKGATMHMTPAQIAQYQASLAAGLTISASLQAAGVVATAEELADMEKAAKDFATEQTRLAAEAETARVAAEAAATAGKGGETANDLLKSQLSTAQASLMATSTELTNLKASTQTMQANHEGLLAIARGAVATMLVPMGGTAASADAMDATAVIAEHARVKPLFLEKFKVGQQHESGGKGADAKKSPPPEFLARLATQTKSK